MRREREEFVPRCAKCGYNLTGLTEHRCPECGAQFNPVALLRKKLVEPQIGVFEIAAQLLGVPVLVSVFTIVFGVCLLLAMPIGLPILAVLFISYLIRNGKRVRAIVKDNGHGDRENANFLCRAIANGGMLTLLLLQLVPLAIFWTGLIWLTIKYPPKLFPF